jgi:hypothetical protein
MFYGITLLSLIFFSVPIIELKGLTSTFNVDEGNSVAIECNINYEKEYRPPFWERINEEDEKKQLLGIFPRNNMSANLQGN